MQWMQHLRVSVTCERECDNPMLMRNVTVWSLVGMYWWSHSLFGLDAGTRNPMEGSEDCETETEKSECEERYFEGERGKSWTDICRPIRRFGESECDMWEWMRHVRVNATFESKCDIREWIRHVRVNATDEMFGVGVSWHFLRSKSELSVSSDFSNGRDTHQHSGLQYASSRIYLCVRWRCGMWSTCHQ